jgi:DNA-binding winged helix-turn-helix (wHTH) protein
MQEVKTPPQRVVTLGNMIEFWRDRGSFNVELYRRISQIRTGK